MTDIQILRVLAKYNNEANSMVSEIIGNHAQNRFDEKAGSYFDSLQGLAIHLASTDIVWFKRMIEHKLFLTWLPKEIEPYGTPSYSSKLFETWSGYLDVRSNLDAIWIKIIDEFPAGRLDETFEYQTLAKKTIRITWSGAMIHLFNHMTHHRGAMSQILDSWGIENDFSGLNRFIGQLV